MIQYKSIGFTAYAVTKMARARKFYEGVLGLKPSKDFPVTKNAKFIEYDIGRNTLAIGSSPQWKPSKNGGTSVALEVRDFDQAVAHLQKKRVKFVMGPLDTPLCRMAVFLDPDGNRLTIHHRKKKRG